NSKKLESQRSRFAPLGSHSALRIPHSALLRPAGCTNRATRQCKLRITTSERCRNTNANLARLTLSSRRKLGRRGSQRGGLLGACDESRAVPLRLRRRQAGNRADS